MPTILFGNVKGASNSEPPRNANWYYNEAEGDGTYDNVAFPVALAGTIGRMRLWASAAPGAGAGITVTAFKNGASQSLACALGAADTEDTDYSNVVTVAAGDTYAWRYTETGSPALVRLKWAALFEPESGGPGQTWIGYSIDGQGADFYASPCGWDSTYDIAKAFLPCDCTLGPLRVELDQALEAGYSLDITLYKNGVATALTVSFSAGDTAKESDTTVDFSDGDSFAWLVDVTGGIQFFNNFAHLIMGFQTDQAL